MSEPIPAPTEASVDDPVDEPAFVLTSVTARYGRQRRHARTAAVLTNLDLTIPRGRTTVVVGPSGSGRSTVLRLLNRTLDPVGGEIIADGQPLRRQRRSVLRRRTGAVLQGSGLVPGRSVAENLTRAARTAGVPTREVDDRIDHCVRRVGLPLTVTDRLPGQLSAGDLQRVKLARGLMADPDVLLLDEPFALVGPAARQELQDLVIGLQQHRRRTIVVTTQDFDEAVRLADTVVVLGRGGRLAQQGTPADILNAPADDEVADLVARDRGWRGLSFHPSDQLPVVRVRAVRSPRAVRGGGEALVLDAQARPRGWVTPERPGQVVGVGGTFDPHHDSLRTALDAALASPVGHAVAVESDTGRFTGAVRLEDITAQIADLRRTVSIAVLDAAAAERRRQVDAARREAAERARRQEAERARLLAEIADVPHPAARTGPSGDGEPAGTDTPVAG